MNILSKNESMLIPLIVFVTLCGIAIQFFYGFSWTSTSGHSFASDDAFITYRYAENFFLGNGIYFNPSEKVEGYSNFLYLLIMTPGMAISQKYIYIYSTIINTLLLFAVMIYFYNILTMEVGKRYALIGAFLVGINPSIWANVTTGLETILILFIFVFMWYLIKKQRTSINILLIFIISGISMLSRVDGFIFPLIISLYMLLNKERKIGFMLGLYTFIFMGVYAVLRYYYYEDVIANTYYAKVSGDIFQRISAGFHYLYNQTKYNGIAFYFLFTIIFFAKNIFSNLKLLISFELIFILVWITYMIYIGGDIYFERFLLPILLLGIFYFVRFLSNQKQPAVNILLPVAIIISFSLLYKDGRFAYQNKTYDMWVNLGKFLNQSPDNYVLAIDAAGKVPYFSKLKTIDMLGLNNKDIGKMKVDGKKFVAGHTKYNPDYTLSLSPNIISAWIHNNQDVAWGLTKLKYKNTYKLKYLINSTRENKTINIYDVEKFDDNTISYLINHKYNYAVLVRKDSLHNMPKASSAQVDFIWNGFDLNSQVGKVKNKFRIAKSDKDKAGYITFGPYMKLEEGNYKFDISYISSEVNATVVGTWDVGIALPKGFKELKKNNLIGTSNQEGHIVQYFTIPNEYSNEKIEIRNFYNGIGDLTIKSLTITKVQ